MPKNKAAGAAKDLYPDFDEALALTATTIANRDLARRIIVGGEPVGTVLRESGMSRQALNVLVRRSLEVIRQLRAGWRVIDVWLPTLMAEEARKILKSSCGRRLQSDVHLSGEEFDAAARVLELLPASAKERARRVLVDREAQADVARSEGLTPAALTEVLRAFAAVAAGAPRDWRRIHAWAPTQVATQLEHLQAQARANRQLGGLR